MSRFMIGKQLQGKGYGKQAAIAFFEYFKTKHNADKLYISVSLENILARKIDVYKRQHQHRSGRNRRLKRSTR